jgi:hypothetical protein
MNFKHKTRKKRKNHRRKNHRRKIHSKSAPGKKRPRPVQSTRRKQSGGWGWKTHQLKESIILLLRKMKENPDKICGIKCVIDRMIFNFNKDTIYNLDYFDPRFDSESRHVAYPIYRAITLKKQKIEPMIRFLMLIQEASKYFPMEALYESSSRTSISAQYLDLLILRIRHSRDSPARLKELFDKMIGYAKWENQKRNEIKLSSERDTDTDTDSEHPLRINSTLQLSDQNEYHSN